MDLQSKFGNCITTQTLYVNGTEQQTNPQTDGQTDRRTIQLLDIPGGPFLSVA